MKTYHLKYKKIVFRSYLMLDDKTAMLCFEGAKEVFPFLEHGRSYRMDMSKRPLKGSKKLEFKTGYYIVFYKEIGLHGAMCDAVISMLGQNVDRGFLYIRLTETK